MRGSLALLLYKYFPYGGLQKDFLQIAHECLRRGWRVQVFTLSWSGPRPEGMQIEVLRPGGLTRLARYRNFTAQVAERLRVSPVDAVVGFNKMPGLDVYFAADPCFEYKARHLRPAWYRLTPRYRHFAAYENAVFKKQANTEILQISELQMGLFMQHYGTQRNRMTLLPPGIGREYRAPEDAVAVREAFRREFQLGDEQLLLLQIGSGFRTKGLDRTLRAIASLPGEWRDRVTLFIIGQDDPREFERLARELGIHERLRFFSGRDDVPRFLQGADLLIHPAYAEAAGKVLLEGIVAGLPVLTTAVCGYAHYVTDAGGGVVVDEPFQQADLDHQLLHMLSSDRSTWREKALAFAADADIYDMAAVAVDVIDRVAESKRATVSG